MTRSSLRDVASCLTPLEIYLLVGDSDHIEVSDAEFSTICMAMYLRFHCMFDTAKIMLAAAALKKVRDVALHQDDMEITVYDSQVLEVRSNRINMANGCDIRNPPVDWITKQTIHLDRLVKKVKEDLDAKSESVPQS